MGEMMEWMSTGDDQTTRLRQTLVLYIIERKKIFLADGKQSGPRYVQHYAPGPYSHQRVKQELDGLFAAMPRTRRSRTSKYASRDRTSRDTKN